MGVSVAYDAELRATVYLVAVFLSGGVWQLEDESLGEGVAYVQEGSTSEVSPSDDLGLALSHALGCQSLCLYAAGCQVVCNGLCPTL